MSIKILIPQSLPAEGLKKLDERFKLIMPTEGVMSYEEQLQSIVNADALLSMFNAPVDKALMDNAPNLKLIANYGVGFNNIDLSEAKKRGIKVSNTPGTVTQPTAEHAFALLLSLVRRVSELDRKLRDGGVANWGVMSNLGHTLENKVLGIIGMGNIGQRMVRMATAFGMTCIYYSRHRLSNEQEQTLGIKYASFDDLLRQSDVVSLHVPLTEQSKHLLSYADFAKMKSSAVLVNTARGPVVNEPDLVRALQEELIAGAALDVFEDEPKISSWLLKSDNVVLAPHTGTATVETRVAMTQRAVENILAFFNGKALPNEVC